jgi:hypothetical protein
MSRNYSLTSISRCEVAKLPTTRETEQRLKRLKTQCILNAQEITGTREDISPL